IEPLFHLAQSRADSKRLVALKSKALGEARLCYDHLAGRLGVAITSALVSQRFLMPNRRDYKLTSSGEAFFVKLGIDVGIVRSKRRLFARQCLDWSERKPHLSGALGAAFTGYAFTHQWIRRTNRRRVIKLTDEGRVAMKDCLELSL
ncbi:MAG: ArsR/SmtB family transcription factor, partial [Gammaproteobacteria bacterium]